MTTAHTGRRQTVPLTIRLEVRRSKNSGICDRCEVMFVNVALVDVTVTHELVPLQIGVAADIASDVAAFGLDSRSLLENQWKSYNMGLVYMQ